MSDTLALTSDDIVVIGRRVALLADAVLNRVLAGILSGHGQPPSCCQGRKTLRPAWRDSE